jgi:hypothetical protein
MSAEYPQPYHMVPMIIKVLESFLVLVSQGSVASGNRHRHQRQNGGQGDCGITKELSTGGVLTSAGQGPPVYSRAPGPPS